MHSTSANDRSVFNQHIDPAFELHTLRQHSTSRDNLVGSRIMDVIHDHEHTDNVPSDAQLEEEESSNLLLPQEEEVQARKSRK